MKHTKLVSRQPAKAQSAYASKLQFKQDFSTSLVGNTSILIDGITTIGTALFANALSLGTLIDIVIGSTS